MTMLRRLGKQCIELASRCYRVPIWPIWSIFYHGVRARLPYDDILLPALEFLTDLFSSRSETSAVMVEFAIPEGCLAYPQFGHPLVLGSVRVYTARNGMLM